MTSNKYPIVVNARTLGASRATFHKKGISELMLRRFQYILLLLFVLNSFFSCNKNSSEKISEVGYFYTAGKVGYYVKLKMTPESVNYEYGYSLLPISPVSFHNANNSSTWNKICSSINFKLFDKTKNDRSIAAIDDADTEVYVKTNRSRHSQQIDSLFFTENDSFIFVLDSVLQSYSNKSR